MSTLPDLLLQAVRDAREPIEIFFRDDDAGWATPALMRLLEVFRIHGCPVDLAVIPAALDDELAQDLRDRWDAGMRLGLHQHGFEHSNHERVGRKSEFGPSRPREAQLRDLVAGQAQLRHRLRDRLDSIFTPPWNRCSEATRSALRVVGIGCISQTFDDARLTADDLGETPVSLDWQRPRWPRRARTARDAIGVMLHHATMTDADFAQLGQLLIELRSLAHARLVLMRELEGWHHAH